MATGPKPAALAPSGISWLPAPQPFVNAAQAPVPMFPPHPRQGPEHSEKPVVKPASAVADGVDEAGSGSDAETAEAQGSAPLPVKTLSGNFSSEARSYVTKEAGSEYYTGRDSLVTPAPQALAAPTENHAESAALRESIASLERQLRDEREQHQAHERRHAEELERVQRAQEARFEEHLAAAEERAAQQVAALEDKLARVESAAAHSARSAAEAHAQALHRVRTELEDEHGEIAAEQAQHVQALERELEARARDAALQERQWAEARRALEAAQAELEERRGRWEQERAAMRRELGDRDAELEASQRQLQMLESTMAAERTQHAKQAQEAAVRRNGLTGVNKMHMNVLVHPAIVSLDATRSLNRHGHR